MKRLSVLRAALLATAYGLLFGTAQAHGPLHGEIEQVSQEISRNPRDPEFLVKRADLYRLDGNLQAALSDLAIADQSSPKPDGLEWIRSRVFVDQGKPSEARADLDRWLARHPRHEPALTLRAQVHELTGDLSSAVLDYNRAIEVTAQPSSDLYLARARVQRQLGPGQIREALRGLDEGMARLGVLVALQLEAISMEEASGRVDEALMRLDTLNRQSSRHERWLVRKAELLTRAGRPEEARRFWKEALEACRLLPDRLRNLPSTQDLELQIRGNLPGEPFPASTPTAIVRSSPNPGLRLLPNGVKLTP
ncbi:MAG: tetratricopeptide repeat protein [Verrucomicrobiota bacterium]